MKKFILIAAALILTAAAVAGMFAFKPKKENVTVDELDGSLYTQTHTVADYMAEYKKYAGRYFDGLVNSYDSEDGLPDVCIPGLAGDVPLVPRGVAYFGAKGWYLISACDPTGKRPCVIFALNGKTGEFEAQFNLKFAGKDYKGGSARIGVSDNNLYIAGEGGKVGYINLSLLYVPEGTVKDVNILGFTDLSDNLNGAPVSYVTVTDGILCAGNCYMNSDGNDVKAGKDHSSVILAFMLKGGNSEAEWKSFKENKSPDVYALPKSVSAVKCAAIKGDKVFAVTSKSIRSNSDFYIFDADKKLDTQNSAVYKAFPMTEGFCIRNGYVNLITSSGSEYYNHYSAFFWKNPKSPSDVMWKFEYSKVK